MTNLAMSLGALPLALSLGDGNKPNASRYIIVGGVMFSLLLTLFVVPAIYSYLSTKVLDNTGHTSASHTD
jgi:multidrug efflux pump